MIKGVIFDIDGTLVDSVDLHAAAWHEAFAAFGLDIPHDDIRSQIGKGGDQLMPVFVSSSFLDRQGSELERRRAEIFKQSYRDKVRAFPRVRQLFERLRGDGVRVALASSAKEDELEHYKRLARIDDLIETETSSDDANRSKPHPDIFEAAIERLNGLERSEILVVGDTPYDAEAAGKAGLVSVGVLSGGFAEEDLRSAGCQTIFRDPADIIDRYRELGVTAA